MADIELGSTSPALEWFALDSMAKSHARPMRKWKSCRLYERFVDEGLAVEVRDDNAFFRRFEITEAGRTALARYR